MLIMFNGAPLETTATNLAALLAEQDLDAAVVTALDETFVPASARAATLLSPGARVEALSPMQGG